MKKILFFLFIICFFCCGKEKENVIEDYEKPILTITEKNEIGHLGNDFLKITYVG